MEGGDARRAFASSSSTTPSAALKVETPSVVPITRVARAHACIAEKESVLGKVVQMRKVLPYEAGGACLHRGEGAREVDLPAMEGG